MSSLASLCHAESSARRAMQAAYTAVLRTLHEKARGDCTSLECSVVAGVPHEAETPDELSFRAGNRLTVVRANPRAHGWLFGRQDAREDYGFFPSAAVAPIPLPPGLSWTSVAGSEDVLCVCTDPMINGCILQPCGHAMCGACAARVSKCPHCRARIGSRAPDHATTCAAIKAARYQCDGCEVIFRTAADACGHVCPHSLCDNERDGRGALTAEERRQWEELQTAFEAPFRALEAARVAFVEAEAAARRALGGDCLEQLRRVLETCTQFIIGLRNAQEAIVADERECRQCTKGNESWSRDNIVQGFLFGREKLLAEEQARENERRAQAALKRQREQSAAAWKKMFVLDDDEVVERDDLRCADAHGLSPSAASDGSADTTDPVVECGGSQSRFLDPSSQPPFNPFSDDFAPAYGYRQVLASGHEHLQCGGCSRPMTDATRLTCGHDMCQCCAVHREECAWCRAPIRGMEPCMDLAEAACLAPIAYVCDACGLDFDLVDDVLFHGCVSLPFIDTVV